MCLHSLAITTILQSPFPIPPSPCCLCQNRHAVLRLVAPISSDCHVSSSPSIATFTSPFVNDKSLCLYNSLFYSPPKEPFIKPLQVVRHLGPYWFKSHPPTLAPDFIIILYFNNKTCTWSIVNDDPIILHPLSLTTTLFLSTLQKKGLLKPVALIHCHIPSLYSSSIVFKTPLLFLLSCWSRS